jgi:hypothetical protein
MKSEPDPKQGFRPSFSGLLNTLLSVTFLVLAAYIAWSSSLVPGRDGQELRWFAALVGAYGIWRGVRTVLKARSGES